MKINDMFPSKYMKGDDLGGKSWSFKIAQVVLEEMRDKKNQMVKKPVVYFTGPKKGLILNKTIAEQIVKATGQDDTDNWPGHLVTIHPVIVHAFGDDYLVIRVKPASNGETKPPDALVHDVEELADEAEEVE